MTSKEPPWEGGIRSLYQDGRHAHVRQKLLKIFSRTESLMILKLGMQHLDIKLYKVDISDDPGLTLTYFTARSNSVANTYECGKLSQSHLMVKLAANN